MDKAVFHPRCDQCQSLLVPWLSMPIDPKRQVAIQYGNVYRCNQCGIGMVLPRPAPEEIPDFYKLDQYYTHGQSHFAPEGKRTFLDRLRVHVAWRFDFGTPLTVERLQTLIAQPAASILDIGCGGGQLVKGLQNLGYNAVGLEPDAATTAHASNQGIEVYHGSIESIPENLARRQFDAVIMSHVLEHVLSPRQAVKTVYDVLRPGGLFICAVPNNECEGLNRAREAWEPLDVPRHLNFFTASSLLSICHAAGFTHSMTLFDSFCRQFSNAWIRTEQRIYDAIQKNGGNRNGLVRNSSWRAWQLLFRTAMAPANRKYDNVILVMRKPVESPSRQKPIS
ncbi:MAG: class I SAM-dependent methyltransferase [Planctomycetota bacterium]|nr:class I SAM-dependent methyltransferase [Planctomycetota bacterium]